MSIPGLMQHMLMCRVEAGQLEFWDTKDMTIMNTAEHSSATDLEWDPTGRYIVTSVSFWTQKVRLHIDLKKHLCMKIFSLCRWTQGSMCGHFKENLFIVAQ